MTTPSASTAGSSVAPATRDRVARLFAAIDSQDADAMATFLTDDVTFVFANAEPAEGKAATHAAVSGFFGTITSLHHTVTGLWEQDGAVVAEIRVDYVRRDGGPVTVSGANIFRMRGELIADYRIYIDITPLYAPAG